MNLKPAMLVIALSLPLAGCGNKGPLVLPSNPPPEQAEALPVDAPADDASVPVDSAPIDGTPAEPTDDTPVRAPATSDDGNG